ncbi:hypothetical protein AZ268_gp02 [Acidianus rod-shaped virus 2]|uniref:Uncharacterized protein n=1 Tax=Acidianus rod-shaped virus 2 TaxID=1732175 RepID=A0A0N9P9B4_9VIRU|nr:hypothetical protein AZ268_gp02 [Acidianus rod-shaped virus 2]ALG96870.1 hypothetical protein [Acidianus rod-shaped virus 2]
MGKGEMVKLNGIKSIFFGEKEIFLTYKDVKIRILENVYGDIVIYLFSMKEVGKLAKLFDEFNMPYQKIGYMIRIVREPYEFGVESFEELAEKLKSKRFLLQFLNEIFPPNFP